MASKKNEEIKKNEESKADTSVVYDLESLWEMKFRDPKTGATCMVRKAFKPRGKLEFYQPYEDLK